MITWMQRHKKWLITTIWVSTIAFVGAGFVGWGSYDFGKSQGAVAKVGDKEISFSALQNEYNNIYNQYSQMMGDQFNQEMADKLKLQDLALTTVIQKYLLLNYANELELDATKRDIAKELVQIPAFIIDGNFDKNTYVKVLSQNRTTPSEFEERLKQDIVLGKVQNLFKATAAKEELNSLSKLFLMEDEIKIKIIDGTTIDIQTTDEQIKTYWEKNKNNYMSEISYELQTSTVPVDNSKTYSQEELKEYHTTNKFDYTFEDGKLKALDKVKDEVTFDLNAKATKKVALKSYLKLKKDTQKFQNSITYFDSKLPYDAEAVKNIKDAKNGTVLKPFLHGKNYIVVKLVKQIEPQPLSYEDAKNLAANDFINENKVSGLTTLAKKELENFDGELIGFVSKDSTDKITGLNTDEAALFLENLFNSQTKKDIVMLDNKAVVFEILQSRLGGDKLASDNSIKTSIQTLKNNEIMKNLLEKLQLQYEVYSYKDQGN